MKISFCPPPLYKCIVVFSLALLLSFTLFSCGGLVDDVPDGYGNVRVSFGSSSRNVTQGDKDNATLRVYFNGNQVEKNGNVFEDRVPIGTRLTITAEAVSADGRIIGKGEESITVRDGTNDVSMQVYTYDNFVVTIGGKAEGYTNFTDAWNATIRKTAVIKMNADTSISASMSVSGNVTLDLNGHKIDTTALTDDSVFRVSDSAYFTLNDSAGGGSIFFTGTKNGATNLRGGGVNVAENAIFVMNGGNISIATRDKTNGNSQGGGVYVSKNGKFVMNGGSITNCRVGGSGTDAYGGGVNVQGGTFEMHGGSITGNNASTNGGGVHIKSDSDTTPATFIMTGGTIAGNTVSGSTIAPIPNIRIMGKAVQYEGGPVISIGGTVKITGGTIASGAFIGKENTYNGVMLTEDKTW